MCVEGRPKESGILTHLACLFLARHDKVNVGQIETQNAAQNIKIVPLFLRPNVIVHGGHKQCMLNGVLLGVSFIHNVG